jgi:hypothetical protein
MLVWLIWLFWLTYLLNMNFSKEKILSFVIHFEFLDYRDNQMISLKELTLVIKQLDVHNIKH